MVGMGMGGHEDIDGFHLLLLDPWKSLSPVDEGGKPWTLDKDGIPLSHIHKMDSEDLQGKKDLIEEERKNKKQDNQKRETGFSTHGFRLHLKDMQKVERKPSARVHGGSSWLNEFANL